MKTLYIHKNKEISLDDFLEKHKGLFSSPKQALMCAQTATMWFYMLDTYGDRYQALKNIDKNGKLYFVFTEWHVKWYFFACNGNYCSYKIKKSK